MQASNQIHENGRKFYFLIALRTAKARCLTTNMAQKKVTRRELVKFNLPLCKILVKFGYSTHYGYGTDERGRVILINGGAALRSKR
ncbi:hypothetical protein [uncultured Campylobacter sp.]|uniref:hypothetical protein n=1 Tax=uncultured Campylobacter sp. TaxID=218934 RepID=UPI002617122E|nr:hypothetical protein [uncultured Campylobacter sp.]